MEIDKRLREAASAGDERGCRDAHRQGATDFNGMLYRAAQGGHRDLCELAVHFAQQNAAWGATDFNGMLYRAAQGGHHDLCELAKTWGATNFNEMLNRAARGGHRDLCELAKTWGATNFDWMLNGAARGGHRDLCELAKTWGATDFSMMLSGAARGGHRDLCELAVSWAKAHGDPLGATDFTGMLYHAACGGHRDLCELAKAWGATNFTGMLYHNIRDDIKSLAQYWRACASDPTLPAWVSLFALLLVTDDYFKLSAQASQEYLRWFKITSQLPLELQAVVCFRCHGLTQEPVITRQKIDDGGRWLYPSHD